MLKKSLLLMVVTATFLSACSEEVESDVEEKIGDSTIEVPTEEAVEDETAEMQPSKDNTEVLNQVSDDEKVEEPAVSETSESITAMEPITAVVEQQSDYYAIYNTGTTDGASTLEVRLNEAGDTLTYNQLEQGVIELPKVIENEEVLNEEIKTVALQDLIDKEIVTIMEEPVTKGYLLTLDMGKMKSNYEAISYSFLYKDTEYGIMVSDKKENTGLILLVNSEGMLEDIRKNGIINIIN